MKKFLLGITALGLAASFTACDKCADKSCETSAADSLSSVYGAYVGTMVNTELTNYKQITREEKEAFLRGMQIVFGTDNNENTLTGMQVATQMSKELDQMQEQGIKIDRVAVMNNFKAAFLSDSIETSAMNRNSTEFRELYQRAMDQINAAKDAENGVEKVTDEEFIETFKAENPEAKTTDTGLTYLIEVEGVGDKPAADANVVVNYTGKHLDGSVFDSSEGRGPASFNLQGVVPGFREGLMLIGKGGKATLIMPADLAYGATGTPDGSIRPNETLIFEVELLDIK